MKNTDRRGFIKKAGLIASAACLYQGQSLALTTPPEKNIKDKGLVFLFQGDSITDGSRGRNYNDLNHIMGHGYAFTIASRTSADFPEKELVFINRGVSGNTILDMSARWDADTLDLQPDVLSILIGINDSNAFLNHRPNGVPVELFEQSYRQLLDKTRERYPSILFVLCEPFRLPLNRNTATFAERDRDIMARQELVKKLAGEYGAVHVPFQEVFDKALKKAADKYWIWDGIHPTVAGHELMAREWLKQVSRKIRFLKKEY